MSTPSPAEWHASQTRKAVSELTDDELCGALARVQFATVTQCNDALVEVSKAGPWFAATLALCAAAVVLTLAPLLPSREIGLGIAFALLLSAFLCLGGARWHQARARARFASGESLEPARAALLAEIERRGL